VVSCCYLRNASLAPPLHLSSSSPALSTTQPLYSRRILTLSSSSSHVATSMPDSMPGSFSLDSPVPPKLDLAGARSQLFQAPQTPSASSSLHRSISSRKRARHGTEKSPLADFQCDLAGPAPATADWPFAGGSRTWHGKRATPAELDHRPNRYRENRLPPAVDDSVESLALSEASGNVRKRSRRESPFPSPYGSHRSVPRQPASRDSWGRTVINMVGKVWDFCWSGAFGGFYAGGGRGYSMNPGTSQLDDNAGQPTSTEKDDVFTATRRDLTPIPGQFPDDDIQRDWVVVPDNDQDVFVDAVSRPSATRRANRKNVSPLHTQRRRAMMSQLGSRAHPQSTPTKARPMSPRSPQSPSSAETQRHVAQMRRRERQEDASLRRLNHQLEAMIQEGRSALGTQVEVNDVDMED
jgi:hypothetical protein